MLDNFTAVAPHTSHRADWQRPMNVNAAWFVLLACLLPLALVAGWLLHAVWR